LAQSEFNAGTAARAGEALAHLAAAVGCKQWRQIMNGAVWRGVISGVVVLLLLVGCAGTPNRLPHCRGTAVPINAPAVVGHDARG
jgi:hypothetical protein